MTKVAQLLVLMWAVGCDGVSLVAPEASPVDFASGRTGSTSVRVVDTRAGDGMVAVYWSSGRPRSIGLVVDPPTPPPPVARARLFVSDRGPEEGFRPVAERADSGLDSTFVGPLINGVTYYFRAVVYDSTETAFEMSRPTMTTPGAVTKPAVRVAAPQVDEPLWLSNLSWSPDGRRLALIKAASEGRPDIFVFEVEGRRYRPVTSFAASGGSYRIMSVDWSPDGQSLAFGYTASATYGQIDYRVWQVNVDGTGLRALSSGRVDSDGAWVTDGELFFTKGTYVAPGSSDVRNVPEVYRLQVGPPVRETALTSGDTLHKYHLAYSPLKDQIVFSGGASGRSLYRVSREGGTVERLTDEWSPAYLGDIHPAWTPDAGAIFFASNRSGHYEVWSLDVASGAISQVTRGLDPGVERFAPRVSRDGAWLAFLELQRTDPSSGELARYQLVLRQLSR